MKDGLLLLGWITVGSTLGTLIAQALIRLFVLLGVVVALSGCGLFTTSVVSFPADALVDSAEVAELRAGAHALLDQQARACVKDKADPLCVQVARFSKVVEEKEAKYAKLALTAKDGIIALPQAEIAADYSDLRSGALRLVRMAQARCGESKTTRARCRALDALLASAEPLDAEVRRIVTTPGQELDREKLKTALGIAVQVGRAASDVLL